MKITQLVSTYRWPMFLGGLLSMSILAQGILVYVATRPDAPRPMKDFYERSLSWDADAALLASSRDLGWRVRFELPGDTPLSPGMPRPVDVHIHDRDGAPLAGIAGDFEALRPADARQNQAGALTALPHLPGTYRTLVRLDARGLWDFRLNTTREGLRFVHSERVDVTAAGLRAGATAPAEAKGGARK